MTGIKDRERGPGRTTATTKKTHLKEWVFYLYICMVGAQCRAVDLVRLYKC